MSFRSVIFILLILTAGMGIILRLSAVLNLNIFVRQDIHQDVGIESAADHYLIDPFHKNECVLSNRPGWRNELIRIQNANVVDEDLSRDSKLSAMARLILMTCDQELQELFSSISSPTDLRPTTNAFLGMVFWNMGYTKKAVEAWKQTSISARFRILAVEAQESSSWKDAVKYARLSLMIEPEDAVALLVLGSSGMYDGLDEAQIVQALEKSSSLAPDNYSALQALVGYYLDFKKPRDLIAASRHLEEACSRNMPLQSCHYLAGYIAYLGHDYDEALMELLQAGEIGSSLDESVLKLQGITLLELGNNYDAVLVLEHLVDKAPQNIDYRFILSRAYLAADDIDAAGVECQKIFKICPKCRENKDLFWGLGSVSLCRP